MMWQQTSYFLPISENVYSGLVEGGGVEGGGVEGGGNLSPALHLPQIEINPSPFTYIPVSHILCSGLTSMDPQVYFYLVSPV